MNDVSKIPKVNYVISCLKPKTAFSANKTHQCGLNVEYLD